MIARASWLVVLALSSPLVALSQDSVSKKEAAPNEVEAHFGNGSVIRMTLLQDSIDVQTRFGKLTVPTREIRRIDFGVHLPEGVDQKVEASIRKLGADDYRDREAAVRELVALGAHAYPALNVAMKSSEPEIARRAEAALRAIQTKVPAGQLRQREDDTVTTTSFTILGRITAPTFKVQAEYFGEVQLPLAALRQVRWVLSPGFGDISVDAAKFGSQPNQWLDTGFIVDANSTLTVTATGQVDLWPQGPGQYLASPKGYGNTGGNPATPARPLPGTLMGRLGENGEPFVVGDRCERRCDREGKLYLHITPSPWNNASTGTYDVKVTTGRE